MKSSPSSGGDAVRAGDASGDDWSRELTRARVVQGLKEMVVALVEVGDFEGARVLSRSLRALEERGDREISSSDDEGARLLQNASDNGDR